MSDRFDDARRSLDEVPAPDLWPEAQRRAIDDTAVPLVAGAVVPRRHVGRWLAVAAAVVLAIGTVAVVTADDDQPVDTSGTPDPAPTPAVTVNPGAGRCSFGIGGDPIVLSNGPADPPLFDTSGQPAQQTVVHTSLGAQPAEIHVPGLVVIDLVGERVEDVQLRRGTAQVWFGADFVQVRWFTGSQEPCESFTVTVAGGTEDGNRHAAVDLAERVLLPSDLAAAGALTDQLAGDWLLERSTTGGVPTDGPGVTFTFRAGEAAWTDGCNDFAGALQELSATTFRVRDVSSSKVLCPQSPTSQAVSQVMGAESISVAAGSGLNVLILSYNDYSLSLRPAAPLSEELEGKWNVGGLFRGDEEVAVGDPASPDRIDVTFGPGSIGWSNGCNSAGARLTIHDSGYLTLTDAASTLIGCPSDGGLQPWDVIDAVMGADRVAVRWVDAGVIELTGGGDDRIVLQRR